MKSAQIKWLLPLLILAVGAFLRLYRIEETLMFQGDQGRDAMVVKRMLYEHNPTLLGPVTSVGNMYLGPFYYYFMAPWLALTYPDPIGPAVGVALLDMVTLGLIYWVVKEFFGRREAIVAMGLYAVLAVGLTYARFSWNPNIAPFFGLLTYYFSVQYVKTLGNRYLWLAVLAAMILIQLHYVALLAGILPLLAVVWGARRAGRSGAKQILCGLGGSLVICWLSILPLVMFDLRHDGIIRQGFANFFGGEERYLLDPERISKTLSDLVGNSSQLLLGLMGVEGGKLVDKLAGLVLVAGLGAIGMIKRAAGKNRPEVWLLLSWLATVVLGLSVYSETVFDHYLTFVLPGVVIFYGVWLGSLARMNRIFRGGVIVIVWWLVWINWWQSPVWQKGGPPATHYQEMVAKILPYVPREEYNIALIADNKDYRGMNYRYFFEVIENPPKHEEDYEDLSYLVVIDEKRTKDPGDFPIFEIQVVGKKQLVHEQKLIDGLDVYIYRID